MTKPVKRTGPPHVLDDDVFVQIEKALGLDTPNDRLRGRLDSAVFNYVWFSQHPPANEAAVSKRLKKMKLAADKLRTLIKDPINQHPRNTATEILAEARKWLDETPPEKMDEVLRAMEDQVRGRAMEHRVGGLILRETDIDVDDLAEKLEQICSFIDAREKSKGGWRGYEFWNELMLEVATIYQEATGKRATVTESNYGGKRYSGTFVDIATIIDEATAASAFTQPRLNSALGPALRRLIEP